MKEFSDLRNIATKSLSSCFTNIGYTAGVHHFVDLWARDSLFACLGNIDSKEAKVTIDTFLKYQRKDGLIPYRVRRSKVSLKKYLGKPDLLEKPKPDFISYQSLGIVPDGGLMTIIVAVEDIKATHDMEYAKEIAPKLLKAINYYIERFDSGLIWEWVLCEWADAVFKFGNVLYTNVLYLAALQSINKLFDFLKEIEIYGYRRDWYDQVYEDVKELFEKKFWNGKYYSDWYDYKRQDYLASHQNCLAVLFNVASKEQSESIKKEIEKRCLTDLGVKSNDPKYPFWRIPIQNYLSGVPDYHNGIFWIHPWITYIGVCFKLGFIDEAKSELKKLEEAVAKEGVIYETYEKDFKHVNRFFYKSEGPFAWSAGLILWVLNKYR